MKRIYFFHYFALTFLITFCTAVTAQVITIPNKSTFFNGTVSTNNPITVSTPVTTAKINNAINTITARPNGGIVKIPQGIHRLDGPVIVKSNVHISIHENAVIKPTRAFAGIFQIGYAGRANQRKITNVRVFSSGPSRYTIDYASFPPSAKVAAFELGWVENFKIEDALIRDNKTFLSGISLTPPAGGSYERKSKNGIVENCDIKNSDYGYGLVQVQVGENILFKNLNGEGGVTLRFESGFKILRDAGRTVGTSTRLFAYKIRCVRGNAAVMVSPHTKVQGTAVIKDITSIDCGFAARIDKGFAEAGFAAGTFQSVTIGGKLVIKRNANENKNLAQIKQKHYKFYPYDFWRPKAFTWFPLVGGKDPDARKAPAIAPLLFDAQLSASNIGPASDGRYKVIFRKTGNGNSQTISGFRNCTPLAVYQNDKDFVCRNSNKDLTPTATNTKISVYPNPATDILNISSLTTNSLISLYNVSGKMVLQQSNTSDTLVMDVSNLKSGLYIINISSPEGNVIKKININ